MNTTQQISFIDSHFFIGFDAHLKNWKSNNKIQRHGT